MPQVRTPCPEFGILELRTEFLATVGLLLKKNTIRTWNNFITNGPLTIVRKDFFPAKKLRFLLWTGSKLRAYYLIDGLVIKVRFRLARLKIFLFSIIINPFYLGCKKRFGVRHFARTTLKPIVYKNKYRYNATDEKKRLLPHSVYINT